MVDVDELEEVKRDIRKAKADLVNAQERGNEELELRYSGILDSLLKEKERLVTGGRTDLELVSARDRSGLELVSIIEDSHRMLTALFSIQGESILLDAVSTDSERVAHHASFEDAVSMLYGCINLDTHPDMLRCIVTNRWHPKKKVCKGAHLLAVKERTAMPLIGLNRFDIWDPRNGLCVLRTIDKRFESKELVYMPISGSPEAYRVEVLYDDILPIELGITVGELNGTADATPATFEHINGRMLTFTTPFRPYRRVLLLVAFSAFKLALQNTKRTHTLAAAAAPGDTTAWRALFDEATGAGSPPLPADGFIMLRFLNDM